MVKKHREMFRYGADAKIRSRGESIARLQGAAVPKYVIERDIPNAGKLSAEELKGVSEKSCSVLRNLGPEIQWVESFVTDDKVYCIYIAPNEQIIREHARQGGFPANRISAVRSVISPTTAEG